VPGLQKPVKTASLTIMNMHTDPAIAGERAHIRALRREVEATIEGMIALLDSIDPDPDLEEEPDREFLADPGERLCGAVDCADREGDDPEGEPSLASPESVRTYAGPQVPAWAIPAGRRYDPSSSQERWARGRQDDREDEHDGREPDVDGEPSLGWGAEGESGSGLDGESEPELGATEAVNQVRGWADSSYPGWLTQDGEPTLGAIEGNHLRGWRMPTNPLLDDCEPNMGAPRGAIYWRGPTPLKVDEVEEDHDYGEDDNGIADACGLQEQSLFGGGVL
jgi:hypothetical protein